MIINRLSILLAERNIRANRLAVETGIAQSTLTRITNNRSSQIDYDTLNKICIFFRITPDEFFDYTPFDFKVSLSVLDEDFSIFINIYRFSERYDTLELTPEISTKNNESISGYTESTSNTILINFPKDQTSFYPFLVSSIGEDNDKIISTSIAQKVFDEVKEVINQIVFDFYEEELDDFAENYVSILEPNEVQKEVKNKHEEIINRLKTNIRMY